MKAKIFAVAKETRVREFNERKITEREIFLGYEREDYEGFVPRVRSGISNKSGEPRAYGIASESVDVKLFGTYVPKAGDIVNVEYNAYGRVCGISKV